MILPEYMRNYDQRYKDLRILFLTKIIQILKSVDENKEIKDILQKYIDKFFSFENDIFLGLQEMQILWDSKESKEFKTYEKIYNLKKKEDLSLHYLNKLSKKAIKYMKAFEERVGSTEKKEILAKYKDDYDQYLKNLKNYIEEFNK